MILLPHPACVLRLPCSSLCYQSSNDELMLSQGRVTNMIRGPGEGGIASSGKIKSTYIRQAQLNDVQGRWDNS